LFSLIAFAITGLFRARPQLEPPFGTPSCDRAVTAAIPVLRQTAATSGKVMIARISLPPSMRFRFPDGGRLKTEKVSRVCHMQRFHRWMLVRRECCAVASSLVKRYHDEVRPNVVTTHQSAAQTPKRENMIRLSTAIGESEPRDLDKQASGCNELV
jgi:hypothetical protein